MVLRKDLSEEERYEAWAVRRIMNGKECCLDKYLRCIPSLAADCKNCYQQDISRIERSSQ